MAETKHFAAGSSHPGLVPGSLRIYNMRFCPYAQRALLVAEAKEITYDVVNVNLVSKPEWFLALNPRGQVPTLEFENGDMLAESLLISDYLDDKYKNRPLYPSDALDKAKDRLLVDRFGEATTPIFKLLFATNDPSSLDLSVFDNVVTVLEKYDTELKKRGTTFFGGDKPGMLDYMIWPWFERQTVIAAAFGDKCDIFHAGKLPTLKSWQDAMLQDSAVKRWYLSTDIHTRFIKGYAPGATKEYDMLVSQ